MNHKQASPTHYPALPNRELSILSMHVSMFLTTILRGQPYPIFSEGFHKPGPKVGREEFCEYFDVNHDSRPLCSRRGKAIIIPYAGNMRHRLIELEIEIAVEGVSPYDQISDYLYIV